MWLESLMTGWRGVPSGADGAPFWAAFWPALYSGVLYSIVTGLMVGGVVLILQRWAEGRRLRQGYSLNCAVLEQRIRHALGARSHRLDLGDALASLPPVHAAVIEETVAKPIALWRKEVREFRPLLAAVQNLESSYWESVHAAQRLDDALRAFARFLNHKHGLVELNDRPVVQYVRGRLEGMKDDDIAPWLDFSTGKLPKWAGEAFEAFKASSDRAFEEFQSFEQSRSAASEKFDELVAVLDQRRVLGATGIVRRFLGRLWRS